MNPTRLLFLFLIAMLGVTNARASADYGPAVDRMITGCTKWYTGGYGHKVVVIHDMEGYYLTGISYIRRCDISVSCHYVVNGLKDYASDANRGEISQLVRESHYAWHARCWNQHSLGIEHEGFVSNPAWYTEEMYQASALLTRHLCNKFGISKDRNRVIGHDQKRISGWPAYASANLGVDPYCNDHTDPGQYWNWNHYMDLLIGGTDNAAFVSKTVADGTTFAPGQAFSCTITMNNNGTTTWIANGGDGYTLNNNGGNLTAGTFATAIGGNVGPGGNASFVINFTAPATPGSYNATFRMNSSSLVYFGATVTVTINVANPAPVITAQPANQTKNPGEAASFTVGATGATSYQWKKNGVNLGNGGNISGATSATLNLANVQLGDAAFYSCTVANAGGSVASSAAQLVVTAAASATGTGSGLRGLYYDNTDFSALRMARVDATVNFDWGTGAPDGSIGVDGFAIRWTGQVEPRYTQTYTFYTTTDDGVRLWINNVLVIDKWIDQGATEWSGTIALTAGQKYDIRMDYYEGGGPGSTQLRWSSASQAKQIIPATQLYRPAPVLAAIADKSVAVGNALSFSAATASWDDVAGVTPFEDFEAYPDGSPSDQYMFRKPGNSASTSTYLDGGVTNYTATTSGFPAGHGGARVLRGSWSFLTGTVNPWLRLTTANSATRPNPIVDVTRSLWFDIRSDKAMEVGIGIRETNPGGAVGDNGGTTGTIEFVGVPGKDGTSPDPTRNVAANTWTTLKFNIPAEPAVGFTGNGIVESTTGKGVLEHLALIPTGGMGAYNVYLDNFAVIQNTALTYSLDPGYPAGASIDPATGEFSWTPLPAQGPGVYNVVVRVTDNGSSPRSDTEALAITINAPPVITAHPEGETVSPGANVLFSVTATGSAPLSYQWNLNGAPIPGATTGSHAINDVQSSHAGDYSVLVTNAFGFDLSSNATLSVSLSNTPPNITAHPQSLTLNQGANAAFSVAYVGSTPLTFQWKFNGDDIPGATQNNYTRLNAQPAHAGDYAVAITNEFGDALSSNATLVVNVPPGIAVPPATQNLNQGSNVTFTVVATGTAPLAYQWRKGAANIAGATGTSYTKNNLQSSDAAAYTVVVTNVAGSITSAPANLTVNIPPAITGQPASQEVNAGANVTFTVTATGTAPLGYQWRKNGANLAGATTSSYTKNNVQAADVGLYSVVVSNLLGTATSAEAILALNAVIVFSDDFESGNLNNWTTAASPATALDISTAQNHTGGGANAAREDVTTDKAYHNLGLELEGKSRLTFWAYDTTAANINSGQTRWFGEVRGYAGAGYGAGGVAQVFAIGRYGVGFGTGTGSLATEVLNYTNYQGRVVSGANTGWFNLSVQRSVGWHKFEIERAANGDINFYVDGALGRTITGANLATWDTTALGSIASGSSPGEVWFDDLKVEYYDPPTINSQPLGQTVGAGANANFSVTATNNALTYQWRLNSVNIPGATTSALAINNAQAADAGNYSVAVANGAGVTVSAIAALLVAPVITSQPVGITNLTGTTAIFSVGVNGQNPLSYHWKKGGVNLTDGGNISGATTATLTLNGITPTDVADYSVAITNAGGYAVSGLAALAVMEPPVINTHPASQIVGAGGNVLFTVAATGSAPLAYQWHFNGGDIAGATDSSYTRTNVQSADSGSYTVIITNLAGTATSDAAELTVNSPPALAAIADRTVHAGVTFSITNSATDLDAPPQTLNFSLDAFPPGSGIEPGSGIFTWTPGEADTGTTNTVTVRVTDNGSPSLSHAQSFTVAVVGAPVILSATISNSIITLTWSAIDGHSYRVQFSEDLNLSDWNDLIDVNATGPTASAVDATSNEFGVSEQRFYRIVVLD